MTTLAEASGAPLSLDGIDTLLSPLTLGDLGEFEAWANERTIINAKARNQLLADANVLTDDVARDTLGHAFDSTKNGEASAREAGTLEGIRKLMLLSLRRKNPDTTEAQVNDVVTVATLDDTKQKLDRISGMNVSGDISPNAPAASGTSSSPPQEPTGATSSNAF